MIGAGVVGLCAAHELNERGFDVTVVAGSRPASEAASFGNGGLVVPSHFEPFASPGLLRSGLKMLLSKSSPFGFEKLTPEVFRWGLKFLAAAKSSHVSRCAPVLVKLHLRSRELYETRYRGIECGYERSGELMLCRTQEGFDGERRLGEEAVKLGLTVRVLSRSALKDEEPEVEIDAVGAVGFEDDAHLSPPRFMAGIKDSLNGRFIGSDCTGFTCEAGKIKEVLLDQGDKVEADHFVLAAGSHTSRLAQKLGVSMPLLHGRGYGFTLPKINFPLRSPAILTEGRVAVNPMPDGVRFVGTMELGPGQTPELNKNRIAGMRETITQSYPQLEVAQLEACPVWAGYRACPPDGMPYLGKSTRCANAVIATGHGMMGMSLGPVSGEIVADVIEGKTPCVELDLLNPDRYG